MSINNLREKKYKAQESKAGTRKTKVNKGKPISSDSSFVNFKLRDWA